MSFHLHSGRDVQSARQAHPVSSRKALLSTLLVCALPQGIAQAPGAPAPGRRSQAAPPLYQRIRENSTNAVSMVYGVSEIGGPSLPAIHQGSHTLSTTLACAAPPLPEQLQPFALFQWMEKQKAADLGILFRAADGSERPFLGNEALVWRSGAMAPCLSADGTRDVLYGWEWDVGVVVARTDRRRSADTFTALQTQKPPAELLAFGENVNGSVEQRLSLREALAHLSVDWQANSSGQLSREFLKHFNDAQKAGAWTGQEPKTTQPIGSSLKR